MDFQTRFKVFALTGTNFIMVLVNTMLFPIFAQMRQSLDIGLREISYLVVVVNLTAAVVSPVGGILADKLGRKKVMIPSIFL